MVEILYIRVHGLWSTGTFTGNSQERPRKQFHCWNVCKRMLKKKKTIERQKAGKSPYKRKIFIPSTRRADGDNRRERAGRPVRAGRVLTWRLVRWKRMKIRRVRPNRSNGTCLMAAAAAAAAACKQNTKRQSIFRYQERSTDGRQSKWKWEITVGYAGANDRIRTSSLSPQTTTAAGRDYRLFRARWPTRSFCWMFAGGQPASVAAVAHAVALRALSLCRLSAAARDRSFLRVWY